ncbi:hypothetical protein [Curtobacterium sp. MCSS17_007]|uniref:hypothetical protein n=1 Tax=Curtobacterium sp. MCSS17_007 TaxID=2175646 RepID=UPI0011B68A34|nr:hypothetical protein [Curtobacterium sp. MCSS17_007]WIE76032.1 hypothetical protein DEJ22_001840 [Curtobacterium sp. MCSS17_007]
MPTQLVDRGAQCEANVTSMLQNGIMMRRVTLTSSRDAPLRFRPIDDTALNSERPLRLGSQDLIRLAEFAMNNGFMVVRFEISDAYLTALDEQESSLISSDLKTILGDFGGRELIAAMHDEFDGLYIVGVELKSIETHRRATIRRDGYLDSSTPEEAENLLTTAWEALELQ